MSTKSFSKSQLGRAGGLVLAIVGLCGSGLMIVGGGAVAVFVVAWRPIIAVLFVIGIWRLGSC